MQIIDGKAIAEKIKDEIVKEIICDKTAKELLTCSRPNLAIILVGEREDSKLYVSLKEREARRCGIDTSIYKCKEDIAEQELLDMVGFLNNDEAIDAILIQLPLPKNLNTNKTIAAIKPEKDLDGFHPDNLAKISEDQVKIMPPVFGAVLECVDNLKYDLKNEKVGIIVNSEIFGNNLAKVLKNRGAKVEVVKSDDEKLKDKIKNKDVLISAVGKARFINGDMIKKGAVLIDIGITKENDRVVGDFDFEDVDDMASFITPVPGGIGPLTIARALRNTVDIWKKKNK